MITDEQILEAALPFGAFEYGDAQGHKRIAFARAVLALAAPAPVAQPLTDEQIDALMPPADGTAEANVRRVEVLPGFMGTEFDVADAWSLPLVRQVVRAAIEATGQEGGAA